MTYRAYVHRASGALSRDYECAGPGEAARALVVDLAGQLLPEELRAIYVEGPEGVRTCWRAKAHIKMEQVMP